MSLSGNHIIGDPGHTSDHNLIDAAVTAVEASVSSLTSSVNNKAASSHTHNEGDVTSLVGDLAGKAATSHSHAESDITNLVADLAAAGGGGGGSTPTAAIEVWSFSAASSPSGSCPIVDNAYGQQETVVGISNQPVYTYSSGIHNVCGPLKIVTPAESGAEVMYVEIAVFSPDGTKRLTASGAGTPFTIPAGTQYELLTTDWDTPFDDTSDFTIVDGGAGASSIHALSDGIYYCQFLVQLRAP